MRTKDTPITQEITRVSGVLCQELGAETYMCVCVRVYKYIFFSIIAHMVIVLGRVALGVRRKGIDGYGKKKNSEKGRMHMIKDLVSYAGEF